MDAPRADEPGDGGGGECAAIEVLVERGLVGCGRVFCGGGVAGKERGEVDAGRGEAGLELLHKDGSPWVLEVAFAYKDNRGRTVSLKQVPERLGVALDAVARAHHHKGEVERGDGPLRFGEKSTCPGASTSMR